MVEISETIRVFCRKLETESEGSKNLDILKLGLTKELFMNFNRGNRAFLLVINQSVHSVGPKAYYLQHFSTALTLIQRIPLYTIFFVNLRARFDMNGTPLGWNRPKIIRYSGVWGPNEVI